MEKKPTEKSGSISLTIRKVMTDLGPFRIILLIGAIVVVSFLLKDDLALCLGIIYLRHHLSRQDTKNRSQLYLIQ